MPPRAYCRVCDRAVTAQGPWPGQCTTCGAAIETAPVPDVVAPRLRLLFAGINPGVQTARARHHFANPQNLFWPLLHEAGFTPRRLAPSEERRILERGLGITNVVTRATPAAADVTAHDVRHGRQRLAALLGSHAPRRLAFVGKQACTMATGRRRPPLGALDENLRGVPCFVLPSTSPANAAVPRQEKLHWFRRLHDGL